MKQKTPIRDVSDTAFMIAAYRAMEGEREDALFHDPLAAALAGERGRQIVAALVRRGRAGAFWSRIMAWMVALRTHIIDDLILSASAQGTDAVLCLGAGLDTRPYRMALPESLTWIEVDFPHIIELKERHLAGETNRCRLERAKLDLTDLPARRVFLAEVSSRFRRVLVLTEGVIPYLPVDVAGLLADDLRSQAPLTQWIVDYISPQTLRYRGARSWIPNAPFLFDPQDPFGFFKEHGWVVSEVRYLWDEGQRLHRPLPLPWALMALLRLRAAFMSRAQREGLWRSSGYMLLERAGAS